MRTSPEIKAKIDVLIDGQSAGQLVLPGLAADGTGKSTPRGSVPWVEASFDLPQGVKRPASIELLAVEGAFVDYHVWIVSSFAGDSLD